MIEHALTYASRGWHVFPVRPNAKEPLTPSGHHDATVDVDTIRAWWERWPDANIGVASKPSGLVVLDVDVAGDRGGRESLKALSGEMELPDTAVARTGSGGLHVIYAGAAGRFIRFRPGLDLLGDGYFIAAPSKHPSGGVYAMDLGRYTSTSAASID